MCIRDRVNIPDERKGEQILLLVAADLDPEALRRSLLAAGVNPLSIPTEVRRVLSLIHI